MAQFYVVTLLLRIGCYEKHTKHLISADSESDAGLAALRGESHNDSDREEIDGDWWDDDMIYEVATVREVSNADVAVLQRYMHWYSA